MTGGAAVRRGFRSLAAHSALLCRTFDILLVPLSTLPDRDRQTPLVDSAHLRSPQKISREVTSRPCQANPQCRTLTPQSLVQGPGQQRPALGLIQQSVVRSGLIRYQIAAKVRGDNPHTKLAGPYLASETPSESRTETIGKRYRYRTTSIAASATC